MALLRAGVDLFPRPRPTQLAITGTDSAQTYSFTGPVTGLQHTGRIWVPELHGYDPAVEVLFPVIEWNHGKGGTETTTETAMLAEAKAAINAGDCEPFILVMPRGNDASGNPAWGRDSVDGVWRAETMYRDELFGWLGTNTRADLDRVCLAGFSMGFWNTFGRFCANVNSKAPGAPRGHYRAICGFSMPNADADGTNNWPSGDLADFQRSFSPGGVAWAGADRTYIRQCSPTASSNGTGRADVNAARLIAANNVAPAASGDPSWGGLNTTIRLVWSTADGISSTSMNELHARLNVLGIAHIFDDLVSPGHNMATQATTDARRWAKFFAPFLAA